MRIDCCLPETGRNRNEEAAYKKQELAKDIRRAFADINALILIARRNGLVVKAHSQEHALGAVEDPIEFEIFEKVIY